jgi:hypothetical protein
VSEELKKAIAWLLGSDTGVSSKTILSVMVGVEINSHFGADVPQDPADFGRCYRLLFAFPEWRPRLSEVAEKYPAWGPLIRDWDALTSIYETANAKGITRMTALYSAMQVLIDEGRLADGWERVGTSGWRKP